VTAEITNAGPRPTAPQDSGVVMPSKRFWRVRAIADERGTRPDIPEGIPWVGNTDGETYVIVTPVDVDLSGYPGVEKLTFEEASRALQQITDLSGDDVGEKWGVGA